MIRSIKTGVNRIIQAGALGILCGGASALFLGLLDWATRYRIKHLCIVYALPLAGMALGAIYQRWGSTAISGGNTLILATIRKGGAKIPLRMAPMVMVGTVVTHLFGGSAGREGTAVQMGGSLADALSDRLNLSTELRRHLLVAGVAGGFGSVFGCPLAGAVFGLEVTFQRKQGTYRTFLLALIASAVGHAVTRGLGIEHTVYPRLAHLTLTPWVGIKWLVFASAVATTAYCFITSAHFLKKQFGTYLPHLSLRMGAGGVVLIVLWKLFGSDYLGLGVPTLLRAFSDPTLSRYAFAVKFLFTAVTLGSGFLGGEVTPLFFIGACLGNQAAQWLHLPLAMVAGVGMASVFAAAAKTPWALSVMAVELFGISVFPHVLMVAVISSALTGHRRIYTAQAPDLI